MAYNPTYKVNLVSLFDVAYADKTQEFRDKIKPIIRNESVKNAFGQFVVDEIVKRTTEERIDKNGRPFKTYKKSYAESLVGQAYGKEKGEVANLENTGDMMGDLQVKKIGATDMVFGFSDPTQQAKAYGHISGKLGKTKNRKRDFLGLPTDVAAKLLRETIKIARQTSPDVLADLLDVSSKQDLQALVEAPLIDEEDDG